jgi:hypothetical protein
MTSDGLTEAPTDLPGLGDEFLSQRNRSFPTRRRAEHNADSGSSVDDAPASPIFAAIGERPRRKR